MKIYHVKTQEDYDALMRELDEKGYKQVPYFRNSYRLYGDDTHIIIDDSRIVPLRLVYGVYAENWYKDVPVQEYPLKDNFITDNSFRLSNAIEQIGGDIEAYRNIIKDLEQTYISKNKDYGNSFEESLDEFGEIAGIVRIGDKFNRIKSLSKTEEINVKDESKVDTLLDMANYCIMQAKWLMKEED